MPPIKKDDRIDNQRRRSGSSSRKKFKVTAVESTGSGTGFERKVTITSIPLAPIIIPLRRNSHVLCTRGRQLRADRLLFFLQRLVGLGFRPRLSTRVRHLIRGEACRLIAFKNRSVASSRALTTKMKLFSKTYCPFPAYILRFRMS